MKIFSTQQRAFDALKEGEYVFCNQYYLLGKQKESRKFIIGTNEDYWCQYLNRGIRYGYEVIRRNLPCHLYIDLDVNTSRFPGIQVDDIWQIVEKHIDCIFQSVYDVPVRDITKHVMYSSGKAKGSMHIIYQIAGKMFKNNAHVGAFMRCVQEYMSIEDPDANYIFELNFIDMKIYTPNRQFRMLGCTKIGQDRYLINTDEYTYDNWVKTKIQPLVKDVEFFDIREPNGSEPKYNTSFASYGTSGVTTCLESHQHMRSLFAYIESLFHARITRYHEFPLTQTMACNLSTKECPWKGSEHTSNTLYVVINLEHHTFSLRCHSKKCDDNKKYYEIPEDILCDISKVTCQKFTLPKICFHTE